jgi:hypothetical protein
MLPNLPARFLSYWKSLRKTIEQSKTPKWREEKKDNSPIGGDVEETCHWADATQSEFNEQMIILAEMIGDESLIEEYRRIAEDDEVGSQTVSIVSSFAVGVVVGCLNPNKCLYADIVVEAISQ